MRSTCSSGRWNKNQSPPTQGATATAWSLSLWLGLLISGFPASDRRDATQAPPEPGWLSPSAVAVSPGGERVYVGCATAAKVLELELRDGTVVQQVDVPGSPQALVLAPDGGRLYVACAGAVSRIGFINTATMELHTAFPGGHTATALALSRDGQTLFVCNRFSNDVWALDTRSGEVLSRIPVLREPIAAAVSPDGSLLVVANHLHANRADQEETGAAVTVIDTQTRQVLKHIHLPQGCGMLRGLAFSPDGRYLVVTHLLARYYLPTTHVDFGRINSNALSVIDLRRLAWRNLLLLDTSGRGAGNPWAVAWTMDGATIAVTHAGTHEVSLVDAAALLERRTVPPRRVGIEGRGPRALALAGSRVVVANYFSDTLASFDLHDPEMEVTSIPLQASLPPLAEVAALPPGSRPAAATATGRPAGPTSLARLGEALFNDATLCFQGWQSCASCHDTDARTDALNWDLLNDGTGNPKNAKSLLWAHRTPPAMSLGVRADAAAAVRAGLRFILFTDQPESVAAALDAYLESLEPIPSPALEGTRLSAAAERGRKLFMDPVVGCSRCHPPPLFTDLQAHDVGTRGHQDRAGDRFDTPTLIEAWRTAPYLHDGSVATLRELLDTENTRFRLGSTSHLTPAERDDLAAYLRSL